MSALALAGIAATPAKATPGAPFDITTAVDYDGGVGCCYAFWTLLPTEVTVPRIGHATVSGHFNFCGFVGTTPFCEALTGTDFLIVFSTTSGDLTLNSFTPFGSATIEPWTVVGGTGRFADASGAGTYTVSFGSQLSITLSGTLDIQVGARTAS